MSIMERFFHFIDTVNEKIGGILSYLLLVMMSIQVMEVLLRYIFNSPTVWAWDVNGQIFTGSAMIAGAYALLHDTHVRLDIFYRNFSEKKKAVIELLSFPLAFLALCLVLWKGLELAWWAWKTGEHANTYFAPILWPVKTCLPIAALLMLVQAISRYGRMFVSFRKLLQEQKRTNR